MNNLEIFFLAMLITSNVVVCVMIHMLQEVKLQVKLHSKVNEEGSFKAFQQCKHIKQEIGEIEEQLDKASIDIFEVLTKQADMMVVIDDLIDKLIKEETVQYSNIYEQFKLCREKLDTILSGEWICGTVDEAELKSELYPEKNLITYEYIDPDGEEHTGVTILCYTDLLKEDPEWIGRYCITKIGEELNKMCVKYKDISLRTILPLTDKGKPEEIIYLSADAGEDEDNNEENEYPTETPPTEEELRDFYTMKKSDES